MYAAFASPPSESWSGTTYEQKLGGLCVQTMARLGDIPKERATASAKFFRTRKRPVPSPAPDVARARARGLEWFARATTPKATQCRHPNGALNGSGAMSDLSPLSGVKQKPASASLTSGFDPKRTSHRGSSMLVTHFARKAAIPHRTHPIARTPSS